MGGSQEAKIFLSRSCSSLDMHVFSHAKEEEGREGKRAEGSWKDMAAFQ